MSWEYIPGRNGQGYPDPTAAAAIRNTIRSQRGKQSRREGEYFENLISSSLAWYKHKGLAFVEKTPEPMRPLRAPNRQGQFLACYIKAGQPDFKGTLIGGRAVVFEAKHTNKEQIDFERLTREQQDSLEEHDRLGAAAFVMVNIGLDHFFRVPWKVWKNMKQLYGHKHMKLCELEPYRIQYQNGILKLLEGITLEAERKEP